MNTDRVMRTRRQTAPAPLELAPTLVLILDELRSMRQAIDQPERVAHLLDAQQAGELLNVPASWVLSEARAGRIPHTRLGRYVRFSASELAAWIAQRAAGPRPRNGANG